MSEFNKGYYRRQGRIQGAIEEQERIIRLLEDKKSALGNIESGHGAGSEINSIRTKTIGSIIEIIKGASDELHKVR